MKVSKLQILFIIVLTIATLLSVKQATYAYVDSGNKWPTNIAKYDAHTLSSGWASAVSFGRDRWEDVSPSPFRWLRDDTTNNDVTLGWLPSNTLGEASRYVSGGTITRVTIVFNNTKTWYTGSGVPSSTQFDARSVATHEFGHAAGLNHTQSSNCSGSDATKATMCSGYSAGKTYKRSLTSDDNNGLNFIYP